MPPRHSQKRIIVLFEDDSDRQDEHKTQIEKALHGSGGVVAFEDDVTAIATTGPAEDRLQKLLKSDKYNRGQIGLIVCDRDLTMYNKEANVQSDRVVSEAAKQLGVPVCLYEARGAARLLPLATIGRWKRTEIVVDSSDGQNFGQMCAGLYRGFEAIRAALKKIKEQKFAKMTPPDILARILGKEEEINRIALYGAGEQDVLQELLPYYKRSSSDVSAIRDRYHRVLGNWLYSSVLRFPGILVNEVAAASYLDIAIEDFRKAPTQKLFKRAAYTGPFADCNKWWRRSELDSTIADENSKTGFEYAKKKGKRVNRCQCMEGHHPGAGYYCMIRQKPVCEKHSRGGISWFPGGADLARVSISEYRKIGPFVGLY
jgi:hypothetical protein